MINENLLGQIRKFRHDNIQWEIEVIEVLKYNAKVKISYPGNTIVQIWSQGELSDHGFEV